MSLTVRLGAERAGGPRRRIWVGVLGVLAGLLLAGIASAAVIGVNEDAAKFSEDGGAAFYGQLVDVGLGQNVMTITWDPANPLTGVERSRLANAIAAAQSHGVKVVLAVYPRRAKLIAEQGGAGFVSFLEDVVRSFPRVRSIIVGNEPNRTTFMSPVSPAVFTKLLADSYDAIKAIDPGVGVIGIGLSPRGNEDTAKSNVSLSPVRFLKQMGDALKSLNRSKPLMDAISFHPYPFPEDKPPTTHADWPTIGPADLARLKQAIHDAFAGTAQPTVEQGLPIHLDEVGWQVPTTDRPGYTGNENVKVVDEATQAEYDAQVIRIASCDPAIASLSLFHFIDEAQRDRFQSGLVRVDGSKRPAYERVKAALQETAGGTRCPGSQVSWTPATTVVGATVDFGDLGTRTGDKAFFGRQRDFTFKVLAEENAPYKASLFRVESATELDDAGKDALTRSLAAAAPPPLIVSRPGLLKHGINATVKVTAPSLLAPGFYVLGIVLSAEMNGARQSSFVSPPFQVGQPEVEVKVFGGPRLTIPGKCPLFGTDGPDTIVCGFLADRIFGLGGDDTIDAGGGNDVVSGGPGNDTITGGPGRDVLMGDEGDDVFYACDGEPDVIYGGPGFDRAVIDPGIDEVHDVEIVTFC